MNRLIVILIFCIGHYLVMLSQKTVPIILRWQDNGMKKHVKKHLKYDTLIKTSEAALHINYSNNHNKPYLLLLHGMGGNARSNWFRQIKPLSEFYNLILPDLIYFGESTSLSQNVSAEFQVQQINEAIIKLGITDKINIMGFSYGGLIAAMYNQFFNAQVNKLIIIDGPVKFFSSQMADSLAHLVGAKNMNHIIVPENIEELACMQKAALSSSFPSTKKMKIKFIKYYFEPTKEIRNKQINYLTTHQSMYQNYNYNLDKTPTLLIWGKRDGVIPYTVGEALKKAYPQTTKLIIFPKAKHDAHFSETKKLNKIVIEFISTK